MKQYLDLVKAVMEEGIDLNPDNERTNTGTRSLYGQTMKFNLLQGFPLVTSKTTFWRGVVEELLWFLRGETNIRSLQEKGVHIWDEWADANGDLGPVYGKMWRDFAGVDQIQNLVDTLLTNPHSRRNLVSGWNPAILPDASLSHAENVAQGKQALPPCHTVWQVMVDGNNDLHLTLYQRSADLFLGVPFNIASYSLLAKLLAHRTGLRAASFTWFGGDCHIYHNHFAQTKEMLSREPLPLPEVELGHPPSVPLDQVQFDNILLLHYNHHPAIKAEVAV